MRPRYKDYLTLAWCLIFDSIGAFSNLYRADKKGPGVKIGEWAQLAWYRGHNNRFYEWLDEPRDDVDDRG